MRDAFDVLGLEPRFAIDFTELDRRQRQLLAELHPNRNPSSEPPIDAGATFARQGEINAACSQLRDPLIRAEMLLQRRDEPVSGAQSSLLLSRIFEQREAIEQAITQKDPTALSDCVRAALTRQGELECALEAYFLEEPSQGVPRVTSIASVLEELRYLNKMVKRGEQALDDFE